MPDMVRSVITLGSPFANDIRATNATRLYEALSGETVDDNPEILEAIAGDLPVPATSIYSRTDGIVNWHTSLLRPSETAENIEVYSPAISGSASTPQHYGRWPTVWRSPRGNLSILTDRTFCHCQRPP